jgi:hypothetical protein
MVQYSDGIIAIWELDKTCNYPSNEIIAPVSQTNRTPTRKMIYTLNFNDADLIASMKTWDAITMDKFSN